MVTKQLQVDQEIYVGTDNNMIEAKVAGTYYKGHLRGKVAVVIYGKEYNKDHQFDLISLEHCYSLDECINCGRQCNLDGYCHRCN